MLRAAGPAVLRDAPGVGDEAAEGLLVLGELALAAAGPLGGERRFPAQIGALF